MGDVRESEDSRAHQNAKRSGDVHAVGIGPGSSEYVTLRTKRLIEDADVVAGFTAVVEKIEEHIDGAEVVEMGYEDEAEKLEYVADLNREGDDVVVCLMGDANFSGYQYLEKVEDALDADVELVPGISSAQVAASRSRTPFEESVFVTLHKTYDEGEIDDDLDVIVDAVTSGRNAIVIPLPYSFMPEDVAELLIDEGADTDADAYVYEELTMDETSWEGSVEDLSDLEGDEGKGDRDESAFSDMTIMVVSP